MGCGCGRSKGVQSPPTARSTVTSSKMVRSSNQFHDVYTQDGALVASYTNIVTARAEARRLNGTAVPRARGTVSEGITATETPDKESVGASNG